MRKRARSEDLYQPRFDGISSDGGRSRRRGGVEGARDSWHPEAVQFLLEDDFSHEQEEVVLNPEERRLVDEISSRK